MCVCQKIDQDVHRMFGLTITSDTRHGRCHHIRIRVGRLWSTQQYLNKWANLVLAGMLFLESVTPQHEQAWVCMCVVRKKVKVYEIEGCVLLNFTQYCMPNNIYITVKPFFVQKIGNVAKWVVWRKQTDCYGL